MDKKKIVGLIGLTISAAVSTVFTNWMTERTIKNEVKKQLKND